ncbi:aldehyde dehydrogenase family protein [Polaromonas sp. C04]|uniref:aldehyde dehydrogenase family protein n=1 Tax=Polaromonas sp. C04 TaxID=1945857 RepID=UPI000987B1CB|nr:aldehyde dehydrogenase family protein [Polaromonas sp. C04]OOG51222.1 aldehyde dehydrogenase family protein [Polaromonas sp. C04]
MKNNLINGEWLSGSDISLNINPSDTSDVIGEYSFASADQARTAIDAAAVAFPAWSLSTPQQRADILDRVGTEILARKLELGDLLAREEGKILPEAVGEVARAGQIFKFFAGEALRVSGEKLASIRPGVDIDITREPLGVIGIITPWNFPIAIPAWKIAPALAYGNAVVFKPAELVPGTAWALAEILSRSGLPDGVFSLVMGRGPEVGQTFLEDPRVNGISFTGSVNTGRRVASAAAGRMAKMQLEMGGKNPLVVLDDADLQTAVNCAVQSAFFSTGQRCTAASRLIVTDGIHDRFVAAMAEAVGGLKVGDARGDDIDIGPVVDANQLKQDLFYIASAQQDGCVLAAGGRQPKQHKHGFYLEPALLTGSTNDMKISREEVFGPVANVIRAHDYDEALALANDTEFGLCAGVCTTSLKFATHFKRHAQAGMVMVNVPTAGVDYHVPFGGRKGSSYGSREQGRYAAEFYTTVKTTYTSAE